MAGSNALLPPFDNIEISNFGSTVLCINVPLESSVFPSTLSQTIGIDYVDEFELPSAGKRISLYSLTALQSRLGDSVRISRLPISIRILLESLIRNKEELGVSDEDVTLLASWNPRSPAEKEIPFKVARVLMQDLTGVPALVDLAAMRDAAAALKMDPRIIEPEVPADLVIDHSVQVDAYRTVDALEINARMEIGRNRERYQFLKWAQQAFNKLKLVPPDTGIVHQVNLEFLASVVIQRTLKDGKSIAYPDTLVGTDSHTPMVNGLGVLGWGVGGIEAEAALLGQPVTIVTPRVIGVHLKGSLSDRTTATDAVLTITQRLREVGVVDALVEFFGEGVSSLSVAERASISNMTPEFGATASLFPVDDETLRYLKLTARSESQVELVRKYFEKQGMFGVPKVGDIDYSQVVTIDLSAIEPSVSGPSLPHERVSLRDVGKHYVEASLGGRKERKVAKLEFGNAKFTLSDGDVVIAAITSCTNTSNPFVMIAAGLLAKAALERGLSVSPLVKTSMAPGSAVVTEYLKATGLLSSLDKLGFGIVGYGCTTCIGNSGPLPDPVARAIRENGLNVAAVLSGNRNFEARIHQDVRSNFLMSPPLVVAYALAGSVMKDLSSEPLGIGRNGEAVYLRDVWPSRKQVADLTTLISADMFRGRYAMVYSQNSDWNRLEAPSGHRYSWDEKSTYIRRPPYFDDYRGSDVKSSGSMRVKDIRGARPLLILGDYVTTDHISPAGAFSAKSVAGKYLISKGVEEKDFNTYGARRGNHEVMIRGTFGNPRIKNLMLPGVEGSLTKHYPDGEILSIFDAARRYASEKVSLILVAGKGFGTGSSRDWAAKGQRLLGIRAVIAESFERIHRSNLVGMGVLPLEFAREGENATTFGLDGSETFDILGMAEGLKPGGRLKLVITRKSGERIETELDVRIDAAIELEYYLSGSILHYVLAKKISGSP
jgi:aconitate hydratase